MGVLIRSILAAGASATISATFSRTKSGLWCAAAISAVDPMECTTTGREEELEVETERTRLTMAGTS